MTAIKGNITRIGATSFQITDGQQAYVPPVTPPEVESKMLTVSFSSTSSNYWELIRIGFAAEIDLATTALTNVASITYYKNGIAVSGTQTIAVGDEFAIEIVRTSPSSAASALLTFDYKDDNQSESVTDFRYVHWTNLVAMSVDEDTWEGSNRALVAAVNGTDTFDKGASSVESIDGTFTVELDALNLGSVFGISVNNTDAPSLNRAKYSWYCAGNSLLQIRANGSFIDSLSVPRNNAMIYNLRIVDTGTGIEFHYRQPGAVLWTLKTTTTAGYSAGTTYYASLVSSIDGQKTRGIKFGQ